jgi:hypothetical protein
VLPCMVCRVVCRVASVGFDRRGGVSIAASCGKLWRCAYPPVYLGATCYVFRAQRAAASRSARDFACDYAPHPRPAPQAPLQWHANANSSAVCTAAILPLAQAAKDADVFRVARAIHPTIADMRVGKSKFDQISEQIDRARLPACRGHVPSCRMGTVTSCIMPGRAPSHHAESRTPMNL